MSTLSVVYLLAGILASVLGMLGVPHLRRAVTRLYRGQSIQEMTAVAADQIAAVKDAYEVVTRENKRLREESASKIAALEEENRRLRERVATLEGLVTGRSEIAALAETLAVYHKDVLELVRKVDGHGGTAA